MPPLDHLEAEVRRLQCIAADVGERLAALEHRAEQAAEWGIPGPSPTDLARARRRHRDAEAAARRAETAARRGEAA
jgi:hypothetical protein